MANTDTPAVPEQPREASAEGARSTPAPSDLPHKQTRQTSEKKEKISVSPLTAALFAGLVGILGTLVGGILNLQVERQKQQGSLILEGIKTGDQKSAARNLLFFAEARLINLSPQQIEALKIAAGDSTLPVLPRPTPQGVGFSPSDALTPDIKSSVEASLGSFQKYLTGVGFDLAGKKINVKIDPEYETNAFIETTNETSTLTLGPSVAKDETAILQQYALYVLTTQRADLSLERSAEQADTSSRFVEHLAWALADYLNCSHRNDPIVGKILGQRLQMPYLRNLNNARKLSDISDSTSSQEAGEIWGGALWEIRDLVGRDPADKMFVTVWSQLQRGDDTKRIGERILDSARSIEAGKHTQGIRAVFARRDLKL